MSVVPLPFIMEAKELQKELADTSLLLVDLCGAEKCREGHIAGAVHLDVALLMGGEKPAVGLLPSVEKLSEVLANIGLTPDKQVVCYDEGDGVSAGRLIWTLDVIGHTHASFLNGGKTAWLAEGFSLELQENVPSPAALQALTVDARYLATAQDILTHQSDADFLVWDARPHDEYTGAKMVSARGGHIPGAIHCEGKEVLDAENGSRLRKDLADFLQSKGITPDKNIVMHCQTHRRSALAYVAAKSLGYPRIAAYAGSWSEWGNSENLPIHTGENP